MFAQNDNPPHDGGSDDPLEDTSLQAAISLFMTTQQQRPSASVGQTENLNENNKADLASPTQDIIAKVELRRILSATDLQALAAIFPRALGPETSVSARKEFLKLAYHVGLGSKALLKSSDFKSKFLDLITCFRKSSLCEIYGRTYSKC
jgi:hypothetical protein